MTVYVDDMYRTEMGRFRHMKMSHMIADSTDELLAMADQIGLKRNWLQKAGTADEHFDIGMGCAPRRSRPVRSRSSCESSS